MPALVGGIAGRARAVLPYVDALRAEMLLRDGKARKAGHC